MEDGLVLLGDGGQLLDGLNGSHLGACVDDGYEHGLLGHGLFEHLGVHQSVLVHREVGHREAVLFFQVAGSVEDGVVFHLRNDDVRALVLFRKCRTPQGEVVGLGPAGSKNNRVRLSRSDEFGHALARLFQRASGVQPELVVAQRIAELFPEVGEHRLQHILPEGIGGYVVEVPAFHYSCLSFFLIKNL